GRDQGAGDASTPQFPPAEANHKPKVLRLAHPSSPEAGTRHLAPGTLNDSVIERNRYLFEHVVAGIAGYGNCVGVPTVAGEVDFHPRYSGNPLVNAMCVGILRMEDLTTAAAAGIGNPVIYLGSSTGKDGIHGATFASAELDEESESKRPNVQIGDPFAEKLLIEATLEALQTGAVVAIQDMGAAGLTCSTIEMSSKGEVGMEIDLDLVPMRESDMSAYELMLSESQERMLAVAEKGREDEVIQVFRKWGLQAVVIGRVTSDGLTTVRRHGIVEAQVEAAWLADNCPTYHPPAIEPEYYARAKRFDPSALPVPDLKQALLTLLSCPTIASKRWVYRQYDQQVQTQTALLCGQGDAAVMAPRGTQKGLALKIDGNARQTFFDPYAGGQLAVVEAARNVACVGGKPVAVTDGLNFGSPEDPHVFWQFSEAVRGIADAAEAMGTPVISGNVSFYNESELGEVLPTPVIGMLGILPDVTKRVGLAPPGEHGQLFLVSTHRQGADATADFGQDQDGPETHQQVADATMGFGASAYLAEIHGIEDGVPVAPNLDGERRLCEFLVDAIHDDLITAAHDCSEGGLAVALAEMVIAKGCEFEVKLAAAGRLDAALFGEIPGRVVVAVEDPNVAERLRNLAADRSLDWEYLGDFHSGSKLCIDAGDRRLEWNGDELWHSHCKTIERLISHEA
ncbi:MAG: phosphoribosylformylglycinamidine synthase subunit PurL, partial [Fimbriimonadales bacterium]